MRHQTHEYIPRWATRREQLQAHGWYRVCGTIHPFGVLLYGGSILIDGTHPFSAGSWVVSYGYWNGTHLETMFVAALSFSSLVSVGYERTHYCAGPYAIQMGKHHDELDTELSSLSIQSWMFITAENPFSQYTPNQNQEYNDALREELMSSGLYFLDGWGIPHNSFWTPEASFLVLGVHQEEAAAYMETYRQNAVVFGEMGRSAIFLRSFHHS